jgi:glycosyltransferase involved in cell wall biosynthesis
LGTDWYSPLESSIRQIVSEFRHRGCRVFWVNPLPIRFPAVKGPDFRKKVVNKAKTHARILSRVAPDVTVFSPLYLPIFTPAGMRLNRFFVSLQIEIFRLLLGFRSPLVLASEFTAWYALPAIKRHPLFFHFADKISAFREVADQPEKRRRLEDMEAEIIRTADLSGCSSRLIHQHVSTVAYRQGVSPERVRYLPHAVDARVFAAAEQQPDPTDIAALPHPIAGYYGSLTQVNDKETFLAAAQALPDWSFVFIGKVVGDYDALMQQDNVHFLGPKAHRDIPRYGRCFDVCFMGWTANEWIANCFPLKTLEYLLLGKPVVCAGIINELADLFPDFIRFTDTPAEFSAAIAEEFTQDTPQKRTKRREAVAAHTWEQYVDTVLAVWRGES